MLQEIGDLTRHRIATLRARFATRARDHARAHKGYANHAICCNIPRCSARNWLTCCLDDRQARRRRRIEPRDRGSHSCRACNSSTKQCARTSRSTSPRTSPSSSTRASRTASIAASAPRSKARSPRVSCITPPAGVIGRGDAFLLQIADRVDAVVLSNDSFQEFHGQYGWLFDKGRLIGGKPVPHVGWVFMERSPVRGPQSRRSVSEAKKAAKATTTASKARRPPRRRPSATTPKNGQPRRRGGARPRRPRGTKAAGEGHQGDGRRGPRPRRAAARRPPPSTRSWPWRAEGAGTRRRRSRGERGRSRTTRRCRSSSSSPPTPSDPRSGARSSGSRRTGRTSSSTARVATCRSRTSAIRRRAARARS